MNDEMVIKFDSDNLIYNRYDIIFDDFEKKAYEYEGKKYIFMIHKKNGKAYVNLWGKKLPQHVFENLIEDILKEGDVGRISFSRCQNNYKNLLEETNDIRIYMPESIEEIVCRLKKKHIYNLNRKKEKF